MASNNPFEFFQQFLDPSKMNTSSFSPSFTVEDIDQKIAELTIVEQWLKWQMTTVEGSIKLLELQKAGLAAFAEKPTQDHKES